VTVALETGRWSTRRDLPVWIALVVLLSLGWGMKTSVEGRAFEFADPQGSLRIRYPAGWLPTPGGTALLDVQDPLSGAGVPTRLVVTREPRPSDRTLDQIARSSIMARMKTLAMYRVLSNDATSVAGKDAVAVRYAFVADPHGEFLAMQRVPVVVRGVEYVVLMDRAVYRIDVQADDAVFDSAGPAIDRILKGVRL